MNRISLFILLHILLITTVLAGRITGFVTDRETGEALIGANVYIHGTAWGTATDHNGYYVINGIPAGTHQLVASYLGYQRYEKPVILDRESVKIDIALERELIELNEVTVSGEQISRQKVVEPSRINLKPRDMKSLPSIVEPDLFRTIQSLPGVLTPSEFSTGLIIRGGNTDQNLILLDGITVYNPSHLGGVFSNFLIDAVKEAELIKGGYNAEYGGRLSAVLNIISREGNRNRIDAKAAVSLLAAQTTMEGPFYNGAWLVSTRRTYFDKVLKGTKYFIPYYFYDIQGHVFTDLTPQDRISFSLYTGLDDLVFNDLGLAANWGNKTYSLAYRKVFTDRLLANILTASSEFSTAFGLGGGSGIKSTNLILDRTNSIRFTYFYSQDITMTFGTQMKNLAFTYNSHFNDSLLFNIHVSPVEAATFIKVKWTPVAQFVLEPGFRLNYYNNHSRTLYPDLRFGMKFIVDTDRFLNFAIGNYHQFIETVQDDFNPTILDNWLAVDRSVDPASSQQIVFGYEQFVSDRWHFQVETYAKTIQNMLTYEERRATSDAEVSDEKLSDIFIPGDGYAYGFETFLQKSGGALTGWLAYTWSISRKQFKGEEYFTNWDRRHALNLVGTWRFRKHWEFNGKWTWQSGQAYTPILGYYVENLPADPTPRFRTIPGTRNGGRYPPYHRLDVSLLRRFRVKGKMVDISLQMINAYNRKNIFRYVYLIGSTENGLDDDGDWVAEKDDLNNNGVPDVGEPHVDEEDEGRIRREDVSIFPLIPSIGIAVDL
ncbi:MAG: carboxypeptidase-like regulatory domain-containing protein [Fidelibacterota bacterium]